jgi:hypothetical protein
VKPSTLSFANDTRRIALGHVLSAGYYVQPGSNHSELTNIGVISARKNTVSVGFTGGGVYGSINSYSHETYMIMPDKNMKSLKNLFIIII